MTYLGQSPVCMMIIFHKNKYNKGSLTPKYHFVCAYKTMSSILYAHTKYLTLKFLALQYEHEYKTQISN